LSNSDHGNGVVTLRMHRGGGKNCAAREIQRIEDTSSTTVKIKGIVVNQVNLLYKSSHAKKGLILIYFSDC